jgi:hypothetical protein
MNRKIAWDGHVASESLRPKLPFLEVFQQGNHQRRQTFSLAKARKNLALRTQAQFLRQH